MMNQHNKNAIAIYEGGACNVRAILRSMVGAADAAAEQTGNTMDVLKSADAWAPVRLMLAQLSFLMGQGIGDYGGVEADTAFCAKAKGEQS